MAQLKTVVTALLMLWSSLVLSHWYQPLSLPPRPTLSWCIRSVPPCSPTRPAHVSNLANTSSCNVYCSTGPCPAPSAPAPSSSNNNSAIWSTCCRTADTSSAKPLRRADAGAPFVLFIIVTACNQWERNTSRQVSGSVPLRGRPTIAGWGGSTGRGTFWLAVGRAGDCRAGDCLAGEPTRSSPFNIPGRLNQLMAT